MYNCHTSAQSLIVNYGTTADIWRALEQTYEGTGIVVQNQELIKSISLRYEDHEDFTVFITKFKNTVQRLSQVMDNGEKIPSYWPAMLFVHTLQNKFPIWADRKRNRQREKGIGKRPDLEDLIAGIQDESRCSETNKPIKSDTTKALHASQDQGKKTGKQCDTCGSKYHATSNYLHSNCHEANAK